MKDARLTDYNCYGRAIGKKTGINLHSKRNAPVASTKSQRRFELELSTAIGNLTTKLIYMHRNKQM